ncbi:(d)CMP kinase [Nocardia sp. BMG111209]|uniref:(d)CMP kinase n=1 Tax=Nocardia sp. BMG111209 TaxID=1160137 RepID=UPI00055DC6C2|nr:(d)CMP kinase [Nocardia sp. BMG111209]
MQRISVVGTSGSGKSTLARNIADRLAIPYIELDAIHHQPGWTAMPEKEFRATVARRIAGDAWVVDGNYLGKLGDLVWARADTVVWFDLPRAVVMRRITGRTLRRALTRRELWNGNRESLRNMVSRDPDRSVILWAWNTHSTNRDRYLTAQNAPEYRHLRFVRLRSRRDTDEFLDGL